MPAADEGPFLKEERKLIRRDRRAASASSSRQREPSPAAEAHRPRAEGRRQECKVILDFLRRTDHSAL